MLQKTAALLLLACLGYYQSTGQKKNEEDIAYYDVYWKACKPELARFMSITRATDSGHQRIDYFVATRKPQMVAHYRDAEEKVKHGEASYYYFDQRLESKAYYWHGALHGPYQSYHYNGMMEDSSVYVQGKLTGISKSWYPDGMPRDSVYRRNDSVMSRVQWFRNGVPSAAGLLLNERKHGIWRYYNDAGKLVQQSVYDHGEQKQVTYFDAAGQPTEVHVPDRAAQFEGGNEAWAKYFNKRLYWPTQWKFENAGEAAVRIRFTIDTDGQIIDAHVVTPFHKDFDGVALKALIKVKGWSPAYQYNRPVEYVHEQVVTFSQKD